MDDQEKVTYFAETDFRNQKTKFGIKRKDRTRHMYIIGKTGMGKSTLLENLAIQDIQNGEGLAFIDPHGSAAEKLLEFVPEHRIKDVIYFAPFDLENPISFNVLEGIDEERKHLIAAGLMNTFKKIFVDGSGGSTFSGRMEYVLNMTLLALLDNSGETLLGVNRMYADKDYRKKIVSNIKDPSVRSFWVDEYAKWTEKMALEATASIQNKIGQFTANPLIRNLMGQKESSFDFRKAMDDKKILIVNLSKGKMGPDNMRLIGGMVVTKIYLAAMSRADVAASELKKLAPFYLYVDEFQNFANESFAEILSESRKYNLALTVANQYIDQMTDEVRGAILGNVGSMVTFRIGAPDAEIMEKEYTPYFTAEDLVNLGFTQIYLKLMIDGVGSQPFSATSLDTIPGPDKNSDQEIIAYSREKYCKPKKQVEENIAEWFMPVVNISSQNSEAVQSAQQRQTDGAQLNGQNSNLKQKTPQNTNQNTNRQPSNEQISRSNNQQSARLQNENNIQNSPKSNFQKQNISTQNNVRNKPEQEPQSKIKDLIKQIESGAIVEVSKEHGDGQQDKIPLASLARDKSISLSDNKSNLRDAIAKALKESEVAKKLVEQEVKKEIPVTDSRVVEKNKEDSKEVPEDVLKKLLE